MNSYLSLHILADGCNEQDITRAGQFLSICGCEFYNITTASRFNEAQKLISQLKRLAPNAKPIWRGWHSDVLKDSTIWQRVTPAEWVNYRITPNVSWLKELGVYVLTTNEVGVLGADARKWSAWEAACIELAWNQFAVRCATLRFSTGNPLDTELENYDDALKAAGKYQAIISPNQYTALNGELSTNWHVGRHKALLQRQDKLGVQRSPVVIGEYALCYFDGNNKPDPNRGHDMMNVNIDQHLTVLQRDGVLYQNEGTTACWFTFGHWQEGGGSFDIHHDEPLLKAVEQIAQAGKLAFKKPATEVLDLPVSRKDIKIGATYRLNTSGKVIDVYAGPYAEASALNRRIGSIADNAEIDIVSTANVGGRRWLQFYNPNFKLGGWIEGDLIGLRETVEVPAVVVPPTPPAPTPQVMTPAQVAHLEIWRDELTSEINKLTERKTLVESWIKLAKEVTP